MPVRYLLDTNMASYAIKGNVPRVRERLLEVPMAEVGVSVVTEAELRFGVTRRPEAVRLKIAVDEFLLRVECCLGIQRPPSTMLGFVLPLNELGIRWAIWT